MSASPPRPTTSEPPAALDDAAFERWIDAFRGPLIGLVASWTPSWREAEEIAQDTFAEAWVGRGRFTGDANDLGAAGAWLRGIAFRVHAARRRARQRLRTVEASALDAAAGSIAAPHDDVEASQRQERLDALRTAFGELPREQQEILRMHYLERTTAKDAAALLGETQKAVEGRLARARRALREIAMREERGQGLEVKP